MWRPVALTAFLALLFMSSRSDQPPNETNSNEPEKSDFGAPTSLKSDSTGDIDFDLARSSAHAKVTPAPDAADAKPDVAARASDGDVEVARVDGKTLPLPTPKADPSANDTRVVVAQGEQKTALTTDEQALELLPPGPDFAATVQSELARLGCYRGRVDNIWGPMSRNAVARFNRVAKANLPLRQPTRALLSSARKAPDQYCTDGRAKAGKVASLDPGAGLEDVANRPDYLPPWMRGEPMPDAEPQEGQTEAGSDAEDTPAASSQRNNATRTRSRPTRTQRTRARERRAQRRRVQRQRVQRRQVRRSRSSWQSNLSGWPGSSN